MADNNNLNNDKYVNINIHNQKLTKVKLGYEWKIILLSFLPDMKDSFGIGLALLPIYIFLYLILEFIAPQLIAIPLVSFLLPNILYAAFRNKIFLKDCIEKDFQFHLVEGTTKEDLERYLACKVSNEIFMKEKDSYEDKNKKEYCFQCKKEIISNSNFCSHCGCAISSDSSQADSNNLTAEEHELWLNENQNKKTTINEASPESEKKNKTISNVDEAQTSEEFKFKKWLWVLVAIFILFIISQNDKSTSPKSDSGRSDAETDALVYCMVVAKKAARFDAEIPWQKNEFISRFDDGRYRVALDVKYQNAFGTWETKRVGCNVDGDRVTKLNVGGEKIY